MKLSRAEMYCEVARNVLCYREQQLIKWKEIFYQLRSERKKITQTHMSKTIDTAASSSNL